MKDAGHLTIFYKIVEILAYADDIHIIVKSQRAMEKAFQHYSRENIALKLQKKDDSLQSSFFCWNRFSK